MKENKKSKKSEKLYDAITNIQDDFIHLASPRNHHTKKRWAYAAVSAAAIAVIVIATSILFPLQKPVSTSARTIAAADYPQPVLYPEEGDYMSDTNGLDENDYEKACEVWWEDVISRNKLTDGYADSLQQFLQKSIKQFLSESSSENMVYSPLNVYIALGMLAELTDGTSRSQILELLDCNDMTSLRSRISSMWNANYRDDGANARVLASSLWLNNDIRFVPSTLDVLAKHYYASSYQGMMGSDAFQQMFQDWLNTQTGGLLDDFVSDLDLLKEDTILALATTVYFRGKWQSEFSPELTKPQTFHSDAGDLDCDFMHKQMENAYFSGEHFSAVSQSMGESGSMWFILPDEETSPADLLNDPEAMRFLITKDRENWESQKYMQINLAVPKFDVSSQFDLTNGLKALGITDVFDPEASDFSPMTTDQTGIFLSQAKHAVRTAVDEKGCTAAAYTVMAMSGGGSPRPDGIVDFILDRPFLFVITDAAGLPLFTGIVRQP